MSEDKGMRPNLEKVLNLFQPDDKGVSEWKSIEDVISAGLSWSNNGNLRRGIAFGVFEFTWEFKRAANRKVIELRLAGFNPTVAIRNAIRKDIVNELLKQDKSNFSVDCIVPLTESDKEIDHRWGRKDFLSYQYVNDLDKQSINDFQLLSHSHNQYKRQQCVKCKETNRRYPPPNSMKFVIGDIQWDDDIGCKGCPLAEPELYR